MSIRTQRNSKRGVAAVVTAALGVSLLAMSNSAGATATATSVRISGADRAATSVDASTKAAALGGAPATFNTKFVVSSSTSYADSVAAAALAGANGATIVLLPADGSLSTGAAARFTAATDVWIVGGPSAVPSSVEAAIQAASTPATIFTRLGGTNRYETAAAVASNIGSANIGLLAAKKTVILANADSFADAVSAGPAAWKGKHPVLLTPAGSLNATTKAAITASGATQVLILGGTSAISAAVASEVDAMTGVDIVRVGGANRFETASLLASVLITSVGAGGLGFSAVNVGIANLDAAGGGADALASSPYLGFANAVLLGVSSSGVPAETAAWLAANKATTTTLHVFGGTSAVADSTVSSALTSAGKLADPTATLLANEKLGTFAVIFSEPVPVANVTVAKFQVLNANASINSAWTAGASVSASGAVNSAATIFVVSVPTASTNLLAGNTIQFLGGTVAVADGRTVAGKSLVIPADTVAPVATLSATIGTAGGAANKFQVKVSEPVVTPLAAAGIFTVNGTAITPASATYTLNGTDVTAGGAFTVVGYDTAVVTTAASLGQAETLALVAGKIKDAAGNSAAAASTTVAADNVAPTVVSATAAITTTATAQLVLQSNLLVQAKTAGVAGNAVTVTVTAAAAAGAATVSVTSNAITIDTSATTTAATVKAALDASTAASALVTSTVLVPAGTFTAAAAANLAGGTSTLKLTTTYSEAVLTATGSSASYDADGAGAVVAVAGETVAPNAPVTSGSTVVTTHLLTAANQLPVLNTAIAIYLAGAAGDVGGNPSAAKASQIIG